ncbi:MAG TPA: hypothetical protein PKA63_00815 [Oligoflexia bacterium]|nr:hypothetical protein [Oligoflexia bacterium]HMP47191.1 hypothetical protein [Oligoflexia bacterium]
MCLRTSFFSRVTFILFVSSLFYFSPVFAEQKANGTKYVNKSGSQFQDSRSKESTAKEPQDDESTGAEDEESDQYYDEELAQDTHYDHSDYSYTGYGAGSFGLRPGH